MKAHDTVHSKCAFSWVCGASDVTSLAMPEQKANIDAANKHLECISLKGLKELEGIINQYQSLVRQTLIDKELGD